MLLAFPYEELVSNKRRVASLIRCNDGSVGQSQRIRYSLILLGYISVHRLVVTIDYVFLGHGGVLSERVPLMAKGLMLPKNACLSFALRWTEYS